MFELLAGLMLLQPAPPSVESSFTYERASLAGFVAVENLRIVDGIAYGDGDGMLDAGLVFTHPAGFFAGTEASLGRGDGAYQPRETLVVLRTFAGYGHAFGPHRLAVELLDYRLDADNAGNFGHQGIGLRYRHGGFEVELAHEEDRPYFYAYRDRHFRYDLDRLAVGWQRDLGRNLGLSLGTGAVRIGRIDVDYRFATAGLYGQLWDARWQLAYTHATDELESFYGDIDRNSVMLRITLPFRVFPGGGR